MEISLKNILIMIAFVFLVSGDVVSSVWSLTKAFIYTVVFFIIIKRVAPDMYETLGSIFNLKKIELHNARDLLFGILKKLLSWVPFFGDSLKKLCEPKDKENQ